ncbi:hypothetical protein L0666_04005 [Octadecabacter sp. CECT 8868]|uniref:hypothetical protein n=1 Tax=Octadecabacter algicola TaxID=2909342 RepID=UPI001F223C2C|nr:hypothetical protein [Octadecabacter algicola]MCF2904142.1 hypothetical protein [Octadecabacter algicola]
MIAATALAGIGTVLSGEGEGPQQHDLFVDTSVLASPNANEVVIDVPSVFHWSRYQKGTLGEFTYTIYPDGTAKIMSGTDRLIETARIECVAAVMCTVAMANGTAFEVPVGQGLRPTVPESIEAESTAQYIARWILTGTAPEVVEPLPVVEQDQPELQPTTPETQASANTATEVEGPPTVIPTSDSDIPIEDTDQFIADETLESDNETVAGTDENTTEPPLASQDAEDPTVIDQSAENERASSEIECDVVDPFFPDLCTGPKPQQQAVAEDIAPPIAPLRREPSSVSVQPASATLPETETAQPPQEERWSFSDLNCSVTASASLAFIEGGNAKPRVSLGCGTQLTDRLSFRGALIGYAIPSHQEDWDPDFTYAFNYKVNDRINLSYSNYSGSFSDSGGTLAGLFDGNLRASYKLPDIRLPNDTPLPCTASMGLPDPTTSSLNLSCGYSITPDLRLGATAYIYLSGEQDEFSPDYSYTVSYRINDTWRLSYNNYSNNRWPWNRGDSPSSGITGGSLSLTHHISF